MPSSDGRFAGRALATMAALVAVCAFARPAGAQAQAQGFGVERFYPSAPGGGWLVLDDLSMHGGLGGAVSLGGGYAMTPLRVTDGSQHPAVVSDQAFTDFGFAVTYRALRIYLNLNMPLAVQGQSATLGGVSYTAPSFDLGSKPDALSDARIGLDVRLLGQAGDPFRLGAGAQFFVPSGARADYVSDGTYRGMVRVLAAGDAGVLSYAAQVGLHIRPLDDSPTPGSPRGSELLFAAAAGPRFLVGEARTAVVVGPEVFGATALTALFGTTATALEGLLSARAEGTGEGGPQLRVKIGAGPGLNAHFGAPEWRVVVGVEIVSQPPAGGAPARAARLP